MKLTNKLLAVAALLSVIAPAGANAAEFHKQYTPAADYEKSVVEDSNGNGVKTMTGACVTHNFREADSSARNCNSISAGNIVYFALGSAAIDAEGKKVIAKVADKVKGSDGKVILSGHTDRSASAAFNQRLSQNRVNAVKDALVRKGVSANNISTTAEGEEVNAVPTKDGVVEKLNRRVEIQISR